MDADESWIDSPRIDLWDKVTGQSKFIEDIPVLPGKSGTSRIGKICPMRPKGEF